MKISKLFHWLYAVLMLLPVAFIGVRCGYVMFNKNAKDSYSGSTTYEINYKYQSNEVNSINDLIDGNVYTLNIDYFTSVPIQIATSVDVNHIINFNNIYLDFNTSEPDEVFFESPITNLDMDSYIVFNFDQGTYNFESLYICIPNDISYLFQLFDDISSFSFNLDFIYISEDFSQDLKDLCFNTNLFHITKSINSYIQSVNIDTSGTLDNVFTYSVNQLNEVPLFSWAQTSFLIEPFSYITGLFGLANTSPINTLLSYWLSISIIWLVFDLVMYLPLLVHRWLDKGVLE